MSEAKTVEFKDGLGGHKELDVTSLVKGCDKEEIHIDVDEYIGQQAFMVLELVAQRYNFTKFFRGPQEITQGLVLYHYTDYCTAWAVLYNMLFDVINNLYKFVLPVMHPPT